MRVTDDYDREKVYRFDLTAAEACARGELALAPHEAAEFLIPWIKGQGWFFQGIDVLGNKIALIKPTGETGTQIMGVALKPSSQRGRLKLFSGGVAKIDLHFLRLG